MKSTGALVLLALLAAPWGGLQAASCTLLSGGGTLVDFGAYNALEGDRDGVGQVQILCVPDLLSPSVSFMLSAGPGSSGSFSARQLRAGAGVLNYNLFRDSSRTQVLGDGSGGTGKAAGSCTAACAVTVYGRLYGGQRVPAGQYSDSILLTLDF